MADPLGLAPVSDAELSTYTDSLQSPLQHAMSSAGDWLKNNWEYVAAGAMVVGGAVLIATGVGGPVGGALSAGIDAAVQKATTGTVNWGEVAVGAVMGMIPGAGAGAKLFAKAGREAMSGVVEDTANRLLSGQPITVGSVLTAGITSGVMGNAGNLVPNGAKNIDIPTNSKQLTDLAPARKPLPVLEIERAKMPAIAADVESAIANGHPSTLTRVTDPSVIKAQQEGGVQWVHWVWQPR